MGLWVGGLELLVEPVGWGCGLEGWNSWLSLLDGAVGWRVGAVAGWGCGLGLWVRGLELLQVGAVGQ